MSEQIRVVIVDDIAETREHLTKLLSFESDIEVVGAAASGEEAVDLTGKLQPDILLMDINMPGMDGIATTERVSATYPLTSIIMMSVQGEADYLRRSMLAGAREFLVKPFSSDELTASIRQVHVREKQKRGRMVIPSQGGDAANAGKKNGKVVTLFAPKGGVGRTTLAVNLAVAAGEAIQLLDCDVEEPNSHLFIQPQMEESSIITTPVPEVDKEKCTGCGACVSNCPTRNILQIEEKEKIDTGVDSAH